MLDASGAIGEAFEVLDTGTGIVEDARLNNATFLAGIDSAQPVLSSSIRHELVFVDAGVDNQESLLADLQVSRPGILREVIHIDANSDGLLQIAEHLKGRTDIDAVHVLSHGDSSELRLGDAVITQTELATKYASALSDIGESLVADGDILLYGCDLASEDGSRFLKTFADLTDADIAASDDTTGHASLGGDWDLEVALGSIQARTIQAPSWLGELGPRFYLASDQTDVLTVADSTNPDPATNEEIIGPFVNAPAVEAIARDPFTGELYGADQDNIGLIDQDTGEFTPIGTVFGNASSASAGLSGDLIPVVAMNFDPTTGDLLAVAQVAGADRLFKINTATGTFVPDAFGPGEDFVLLDTAASGGGASVDDIAVDDTGQIYVTTAAQLLEVDVVGNVATVTALPNPFGAGITDMEGLSADADGNLWGSTGSAGVGTANSIWQIDKTTGEASNQIPLDDGGDYEGLEAYCSEVDLELDKTTTATSVNVGDTVTFTVTVTNADPNILAPGVEVTDPTPAGLTFVNATPSKGTFDSTTGTWDVGVLAAGSSETIQLTYQVDSLPASGSITNTAEISEAHVNDPDSTPDNGDATEDDQASVVLGLPDKDWDGVPDADDADADGDGILDGEETTVAIDSGFDGAITAANLSFGITSNSPTTQSEAHFLDSITINGVNSIIDGVYTDLIVPDGYSANFSTNQASDVDVLENGTTTANINDANFEDAALAAFQDTNLQHFQRLDQHDFSSDTYTLSYDTPVLSSAGGFIAFTERGGNNPLQAESFDVDGNPLGNINLATANYVDTGHRANNFQNIEIALFPIDDLAPVGSEIASIRITLAGNTSDGPDGKVFLYGEAQSFSTGIDTDQDGIYDHCDFDADNDGISDLQESGNAVAIAADTNMDGTISTSEAAAAGFTDNDGDGAWDQLGTAVPDDSDGDSIPDYLDLDSDNDGIPDAVEAQPTAGYQTPSIGSDADNDGVVDTFDDPAVEHGGAFTIPEDTDGDGEPDYLDTDSDNDGVNDTTESGLTPGADNNGDGIADNIAPNSYFDTDGIITNPSSDLDNESGNTTEVGYREIAAANLVTVKTLASGDSTPGEGDTVTFEIEVTNNGPDGATNVSLTDLLPAGLTATGNSGDVTQGSYNAGNGLWNIGTLANGASATLTLEGTVNSGQGGNMITNTTTAAVGDQDDPSTVGDDLEEDVTVSNEANLVTVKTLASSDSTPAEGDTVTFEIEVTNNGPDGATNVSLTDLLPAGLTATGNNGDVTQGSYNAGSGLWTIGSLANGASVTLTLEGVVNVGQGGNTITNTTTAAMGDQDDPSTVGDDLLENVFVATDADLVTVKTLTSSDVTPAEGDTVTFEVRVTNNGAAQATNVSLTDLLPPGLTATGNNGTVSQGSYNSGTGDWNIGTLADGAFVTLTLEGTVNVGQGGNTITNTTTAATGDQPDPTTAGDDLNAQVIVSGDADLVTAKVLASGDATPTEGEIVTFEINVTNNGAAQATNVSLTDLLPAGLTATGNNGTVTQGSYNAASGLWNIGTIADGAMATLTLEGVVNVGQGGNTINNTTTAATGDQPDPSTAGDDLEEDVVVENNADLVTVKTLASGDNTPNEGDTVVFEIEVTNNGAAQATSVSLTDLLPPGMTATGNNGMVTQGSYNATSGLWNIGTLADGGTATLTLEGTVNVGQGGNTINNTTTAAAGDQNDPSTAGDDLEEDVTVDNNADLVTVKTLASADNTPAEGDTVTFEVQVSNNGAAQATNVSLSDLLPPGLTATGNNGMVTQGTYNAASGLWNIGTIANGGVATLTLEGTLNAGQGGNTITNTTTAAMGDQPDPSTAGDDLTETVGSVNFADLVTVKTLASGDDTPLEGDTVTFQIAVTNNGAAQATGVSLTDFLPAGMTATGNNGNTSQGTYNAANGTWNIGTLANGAVATLTLEGIVDVGQGGNMITNTTTAAAGDQPDPSTAGDDLEEDVTVENNANLVTVKTLASGDNTPNEGDTVTFQIQVTNNGAAQATGVSLTDFLPAGMTATGNNGSTSQGTYNAANGTWNIGTLANGAVATLTLEGIVDVGQGGNMITNTTTAAAGDQPDPSTAGDDLEEDVTVENEANLVTVKTLASGDNTPNEGDTVTFQIQVTNNGAARATGVSLNDLLPAGMTATANNGSASQGSYSAASGTWNIGTLANGAVATLTLEGIVDAGQGGNMITNTTTAATGDQPDPSTAGDDLEEDVMVGNAADLVTVKTLASGDNTPNEGDTVTFQIQVTNNGMAQATSVSLTDFLPGGMTATGNNGTTSQGSYNATSGLWNIGTLANGAVATLTLEGIVDVGQGGNTIINTTTAAAGDQPDPSTAGDDLEEDVMVGNAADLVTVKTLASGDSTPAEGDTVTFQIQVTNNGMAQATNVSLADLLPPGMTATANNGTTSQGPYNAANGLWNIGTLANGASATLTLEGVVNVGQGGNTITNTTTAAAGDQPDPSTAGDDLEEEVVVENEANLVTVKTLASGTNMPVEGDTVTFEIQVTNNGAAQATNVSLTDLLPPGLTATVNNGMATAGNYNAANGLWTIGTLNNGDIATLTLEGTLDAGQSGNTITNTTTAATGDQPDPTTGGDDLTEIIGSVNLADLMTVKTLASGDDTPLEGDTVTFQIQVTNNGAAQATGVSLMDLLPAGMTATTNNGMVNQGTYNAANGTWDIGTLANGAVVTLTLEGIVDVGQGGNTITNMTTAAAGDQPDPSTFGDDLEEDVTVENNANLVTVKTLASGDNTPNEGDIVTFQIQVTNNGAAQATGVSLNDVLPAGMTATANNGTTSQGPYNATSGLWNIGTLANGAVATLTLEGIVDAGQGGSTITNTTTAAAGDQPDPSTVGDDLEEDVVVNNEANLVTVKTLASGDNTPNEGDTVTFLISVVNVGAARGTGISLTDLLPAGMTATANNGTVTQGSYSDTTGIWNVGTLDDGGLATLTLEGIVDAGQGGNMITNTTTAAAGDQPDPSTDGDDLEEDVVVGNAADLVTVKTLASGDNTPNEGDTVTFQIQVTNNGMAQATGVSLIDVLPAGMTATTNNGTTSQGSYSAVTGSWSIGTLANGAVATLTLEGIVDVGQGGNTITNMTTAAAGDQPDPSTDGDDLEEDVTVGGGADLVTVKTLASGDSNPTEGEIVTFAINVTNNGAAQATSVSLTDTLPAGITATANNGTTSQGLYDATTGLWNIGTLANGAVATLTLEGIVDIGQGGNTITNMTTAATGDQPDPSTDGDDLEEEVIVDNNANLVTVKTLASLDGSPSEGDVVTFAVNVTNNGIAQATNVSLTDMLPAGMTATVNNGMVTQGSYDAASGVWTIGTLSNGATATLTIEGILDVGQSGNTITNITTAATGDQPDPTTDGDDLTESVGSVAIADLVTVKTLASGDNTPIEGEVVTFSVRVTNNGSSQATNVSLTDLLPAGLTATTNNGGVTQGSYSSGSGLWTIGTLATGDSAILTLEGIVDTGQGGNTIANLTTAAAGDQLDPSTAGDDLEEEVIVDNGADLVTTKILASGDSSPNEGDTVTFTINVSNNGAALATNVSLMDLLPSGMTATVNNGFVTQGTYDGATGLWNIGDIPNGGIAVLTLEGTVNIGQSGNTITNVTTAATGDQPDPTTDGDDLEEDVFVGAFADLVTTKTLVGGDVTHDEGATVVFEVQVRNNGASMATNVSLTDLLPAGMTATANNGMVTQGSYDPVSGVWSIGSLADGAVVTLTLEGTVDTGEAGNTITNVTTAATGDQNDPTTDGDDLEESIMINPDADLVTTKVLASGDSTPAEGDTVAFTITVTNNGPAEATNVSLSDVLPAGITATANNGATSQGSYDPASGLWTIGTLADGGAATLTLEGTVNVGEDGNTLTNVTTAATGDQPDLTTDGDDLEEVVVVDSSPVTDATVGVAKDAVYNDATDTVTFAFNIEHFGNIEATSLSMTEDLDAIFGAGNYTVSALTLVSGPTTISVATGFDGSSSQEVFANGSSMQPGETAEIQFVVTVHQIADTQSNGLGFYENQVTLTALGSGISYVDVSVDGTNPDPGGDGDPTNDASPTPGNLTPFGYVGAAKTATVAGDGNGVVFDFYLEHLGNTEVSVSLVEDLAATFITGGSFSVVSVNYLGGSPTVTANGMFDGTTDQNLITAGSTMLPGETAVIQVAVQLDGVTGELENQATVIATDDAGVDWVDQSHNGTDADPDNDFDPRNNDDPTPFAIGAGSIAGTSYVDINNDGIQDPEEVGIAGVEIILTGTDVNGFPVEFTAITDADGNYLFDNLPAGDYTITQTQPSSFIDGIETPGTGGTVSGDDSIDVSLSPGSSVTSGNNFGERGLDLSFTGKDPFLLSNLAGTSTTLTPPSSLVDLTTDGASSIRIEGRQVTLDGLGGDDVIDIQAGTTEHRISINQVEYRYDASEIDLITVFARGGNDQVTVRGSELDDRVVLMQNSARVTSSSYEINVRGSEFISAYGGAGDDSGFLVDSEGRDVFVVTEQFASMRELNNSYKNELRGFETVTGNSIHGGFDRATIYDTSADDLVQLRPGFAQLFGDAMEFRAVGFDSVETRAVSRGNDRVEIIDSTDDDVFIAEGTTATMIGGGYRSTAYNFESARAIQQNGGNDIAQFHDTAGDDQFNASVNYSWMTGNGYRNEAVGFSTVNAYSQNGGEDRATLTDSAGDDIFVSSPTVSSIRGDGYLHRAEGFDIVIGVSIAGGNDTAYLYDSAGNDTYVARPTFSELRGDGFANRALNFETVYAKSDAGGDDIVVFIGGDGSERFIDRVGRAQMHDGPGGTYRNVADNFETIQAHGDESDVAEVNQVAGGDTLAVQGNTARLSGSRSTLVKNFGRVQARSEDNATASIGDVDFIFEQFGTWRDAA